MNLIKRLIFLLKYKTSSRKYVFITGVPRSGTTLLKTILTTHSEIGSCQYESTGLFKWRDFDNYRVFEIDDLKLRELKEASSTLVDFYEKITEYHLLKQGKKIFLDKIWPSKIRLKYVKNRFPNSIFIHIIRDGRDCYCSALKHPNIPQKKSIENFASYWTKSVNMIQSQLKNHSFITIKYEDLVTKPKDTVRLLIDAIGIEFENEILDEINYSRNAFMSHRDYHSQLKKPINKTSVNRWPTELSRSEILTFNKIASNQLKKFSYD